MENDPNKTENQTEQEVTVGNFCPEDADGIVRLFRSVYGENYPIRLFYDPAAIIAANKDGRYYSIVARSPSGEVIGVTHLFPSAPNPSLYEAGVGLVLKEYRNLGVNGRVLRFLYEEFVPQNPHIEEVFGEAVCNHIFQQKVLPVHKFVTTALEVALMPAEAYSKEKSATGRVATLDAFRSYHSRPHRIYLPAAYEGPLRWIYAQLDDTRQIDLSSTDVPNTLNSKGNPAVFEFAQVARMAVHEIGNDFNAFFSDFEARSLAQNAVVLQAWVNLTTPWVGKAVDILRDRGYFFGGALPRWFGGDGFLMQKLLCPPDFDSIQLVSDFAKKLLSVVKEDWQRANSSGISASELLI
ncbi:MAG: hypothetical protein HY881_04655 [Deltaproteobacteria bacterium]|nr:hypothetical protein [Deltaproteobacteria bacterium]